MPTRYTDADMDVIRKEIGKSLSKTFEELFKKYDDDSEIRLAITEYTMGYMGASFKLHIPQ